MFALEALTVAEASRIEGVVFDLDDTVLDHGRLTPIAFTALWRAHDAGLRLVAATGRPAGWGEVIARTWPVDAAVAENGAVAFFREGPTVVRSERATPSERATRREALARLTAEMSARFGAAPSDDVGLRLTDYTFDIGEARREPPARVAAMAAFAREQGARVVTSSVHLHVSFEGDDKASGVLRLLATRLGVDPTVARGRYAFIGDSGNDVACFNAFSTTVGVANVRAHLRVLSLPPRYVTHAERGRGFAEFLDALLARRRGPSGEAG